MNRVRLKYQLDPGRSLRVAVGDTARAQLDAALRRARRGDGDGARAVHAVRTHLKKLRALLRLVRAGMPAVYKEENGALRDTARLLAPLRDANVVLRTHDALLASFGGAIDVPAAGDLRGRLEQRFGNGRAPGAELEQTLAEVIARLEAARERVPHWHLHGSDARIVYRGMKWTYRRARRAGAAAAGGDDPARFHEWRKCVKCHWYHLRLVAALSEGRLEGRERRINRLGKLLGEAHDLAVYEHYVAELCGAAPPADCAALLALAAYRRVELQQRALRESAGLFADKASAALASLVA